MSQKGEHTWDIVIHYHHCPECGYIIESREGYQYIFGKHQKEVFCDRCHDRFMVVKPTTPAIGPLIGDPQPAESEWGDPKV